MRLHDKMARSRSILEKMGNAVIADSGGVDSAFLLKVHVY